MIGDCFSRAFRLAIFGVILTTWGTLGWARPGGGHGFSGHSSHSGGGSGYSSHSYSGGTHSSGGTHYSGGSGGTNSGAFLLFGFFSLVVLVGVLIKSTVQEEAISTLSTRGDDISRTQDARQKLEVLASGDPHFSEPVFLDFAQRVVSKFMTLQGSSLLESLRGFMEPNLLARHKSPGRVNRTVTELVIGNLSVREVRPTGLPFQIIYLFVQSSYTETLGGRINRVDQSDLVGFRRQAGIPSKSPGPLALTTLPCPNCGASFSPQSTGACSHCGQVPIPAKDWELFSFKTLHRISRPHKAFGSYAPEIGTGDLNVFDPQFHHNLALFGALYHHENPQEYLNTWANNFVTPCFVELYQAWTHKNTSLLRPHLTDGLYEHWAWWIAHFKRFGLTNHLEYLKVDKVIPVKITLDAHFESITVRIFASCYDYLTDKDGSLVGGSKRLVREFSEYWTFLRRKGVDQDLNRWVAGNCPNCGTKLSIGQSGECSHCHSLVTNGAFGWVLSAVTQDEAYVG